MQQYARRAVAHRRRCAAAGALNATSWFGPTTRNVDASVRRIARRRALAIALNAKTSAAATVAGSSDAACAKPSTTRTACGSIANSGSREFEQARHVGKARSVGGMCHAVAGVVASERAGPCPGSRRGPARATAWRPFRLEHHQPDARIGEHVAGVRRQAAHQQQELESIRGQRVGRHRHARRPGVQRPERGNRAAGRSSAAVRAAASSFISAFPCAGGRAGSSRR